MELRRFTAADLEQVRDVWKTCFQDSDAFLDTYFESAMDVENGIGFFDGDRLVSDLFALDLDAQIQGMVYPSEFLAGCATLPEARNQHLMRDLIRSALADMRERSVCVTFLHPFLHAFYRKFGYETVSYVKRELAASSSGSGVKIASRLEDVPEDALYASYGAYVSQYGSYFMRSAQRMDAWLKLLFSDGGRIAYIDGESNTPYALFYPETDSSGNEQNSIFELVYFEHGQRQALTGGTGAPASYFVPCSPGDEDAEEFTMMRVLRPDIMLQSFQYPAGTKPFVMNIHDAFLGTDRNLLVTPGSHGAQTTDVEAASDIVVDIGALGQLFTGMYEPQTFPAAADVFPPGSSCYFETY